MQLVPRGRYVLVERKIKSTESKKNGIIIPGEDVLVFEIIALGDQVEDLAVGDQVVLGSGEKIYYTEDQFLVDEKTIVGVEK